MSCRASGLMWQSSGNSTRLLPGEPALPQPRLCVSWASQPSSHTSSRQPSTNQHTKLIICLILSDLNNTVPQTISSNINMLPLNLYSVPTRYKLERICNAIASQFVIIYYKLIRSCSANAFQFVIQIMMSKIYPRTVSVNILILLVDP